MNIIELTQVSKTFPDGNKVLNNINLTIKQGAICGIVGKSGAGKSTLLRCINLLERPTSGTVKVARQELTTLNQTELRQARQKIGMIFQQFNLLSSLTVFDNVALPLTLNGMPAKSLTSNVLPLLELVGLTDKRDYYPAQLSGGQKQRVAIARALAAKPKLLLCDEATSALDFHTTRSILQLLKQINQQFGLTIVLITHEMDVIKEIVDHVVVIDKGEIIEQAPIIQLFTQPNTTIAKGIVESSLRQELPEILQKQLTPTQTSSTSNPVLRLIFHGATTTEPLVAHLIQKIGLEVNILQASLEFIKETLLGVMVIEVMAQQEKINAAIQYLISKNLSVEVIGYVPSSIHRTN